MRAQDIIPGNHYRLRSSPNYGWIKVLRVLRPNEGKNKGNRFISVECEHTVNKNDKVGFIRLFKPADIIKPE